MNRQEKKEAVPIWERVTITLEEASAFSGIGINKLREMSDDPVCEYVIWVGNRRMFKRKKLEEYLLGTYSV